MLLRSFHLECALQQCCSRSVLRTLLYFALLIWQFDHPPMLPVQDPRQRRECDGAVFCMGLNEVPGWQRCDPCFLFVSTLQGRQAAPGGCAHFGALPGSVQSDLRVASMDIYLHWRSVSARQDVPLTCRVSSRGFCGVLLSRCHVCISTPFAMCAGLVDIGLVAWHVARVWRIRACRLQGFER